MFTIDRKIVNIVDKVTLILTDLLDPDYRLAISGYSEREISFVIIDGSRSIDLWNEERTHTYVDIKLSQDGQITISSGSKFKVTYQPETLKRNSRTFWTMILARALTALGIN